MNLIILILALIQDAIGLVNNKSLLLNEIVLNIILAEVIIRLSNKTLSAQLKLNGINVYHVYMQQPGIVEIKKHVQGTTIYEINGILAEALLWLSEKYNFR